MKTHGKNVKELLLLLKQVQSLWQQSRGEARLVYSWEWIAGKLKLMVTL